MEMVSHLLRNANPIAGSEDTILWEDDNYFEQCLSSLAAVDKDQDCNGKKTGSLRSLW